MTTKLWRQRIRDALAANGRSARAVSLEAGMSANYVHGILNEDKEPTLPSLLAVCDVLGVSLPYIIHGYALNHTTERILKAWMELSPEDQKDLLKKLDALIEAKPSASPKSPSGAAAARDPRPAKSRRSQIT